MYNNFIGIKLRELRKNNSYSTKQIVKKLSKYGYEYSEQSIFKWEEGSSIPPIPVLNALSEIYNCSLGFIIDKNNVEYTNLSVKENYLLELFRNNILFRSITIQILKLINN